MPVAPVDVAAEATLPTGQPVGRLGRRLARPRQVAGAALREVGQPPRRTLGEVLPAEDPQDRDRRGRRRRDAVAAAVGREGHRVADRRGRRGGVPLDARGDPLEIRAGRARDRPGLAGRAADVRAGRVAGPAGLDRAGRAAAVAVGEVALVALLGAGLDAVAADGGGRGVRGRHRTVDRGRVGGVDLVTAGGVLALHGATDADDRRDADDGRAQELAELEHENLRLRMRPPPEWRQTLGNVGCRTTWFDSLHLQYDRR